MTRKLLLLLLAGALALPACKARKDFPEPNLGWHSNNYGALYGTLRKLTGSTPQAKPTWVIVFGSTGDPYQGVFALTQAPVGYTGGERVEVKGHLLDQPTTDAFNGRWYVVDSIQLWADYR